MFILFWKFPLDFHNPVKKCFKNTFTSRQRWPISLRISYQLKGQRIDSRRLIQRWSHGGAGCDITQKALGCSLLCWCHLEILHWFWPSVPETPFSHDGKSWVMVGTQKAQGEGKGADICWARIWKRHVFMQFVWVIHQNNSAPGKLHKSAPTTGKMWTGELGFLGPPLVCSVVKVINTGFSWGWYLKVIFLSLLIYMSVCLKTYASKGM